MSLFSLSQAAALVGSQEPFGADEDARDHLGGAPSAVGALPVSSQRFDPMDTMSYGGYFEPSQGLADQADLADLARQAHQPDDDEDVYNHIGSPPAPYVAAGPPPAQFNAFSAMEASAAAAASGAVPATPTVGTPTPPVQFEAFSAAAPAAAAAAPKRRPVTVVDTDDEDSLSPPPPLVQQQRPVVVHAAQPAAPAEPEDERALRRLLDKTRSELKQQQQTTEICQIALAKSMDQVREITAIAARLKQDRAEDAIVWDFRELCGFDYGFGTSEQIEIMRGRRINEMNSTIIGAALGEDGVHLTDPREVQLYTAAVTYVYPPHRHRGYGFNIIPCTVSGLGEVLVLAKQHLASLSTFSLAVVRSGEAFAAQIVNITTLKQFNEVHALFEAYCREKLLKHPLRRAVWAFMPRPMRSLVEKVFIACLLQIPGAPEHLLKQMGREMAQWYTRHRAEMECSRCDQPHRIGLRTCADHDAHELEQVEEEEEVVIESRPMAAAAAAPAALASDVCSVCKTDENRITMVYVGTHAPSVTVQLCDTCKPQVVAMAAGSGVAVPGIRERPTRVQKRVLQLSATLDTANTEQVSCAYYYLSTPDLWGPLAQHSQRKRAAEVPPLVPMAGKTAKKKKGASCLNCLRAKPQVKLECGCRVCSETCTKELFPRMHKCKKC